MEATNFANRHEMLGVGTHSSAASANHAPRQTNDITKNTVNPGPTLREGTGTRDFADGPGNYITSPAHNSTSEEARLDAARSTEMGDPNSGIPTAQDTHNQLKTAQSELVAAQNDPPPASHYFAQGVPRSYAGDADAGVPTSQRGHRNSNYAPGYEDAADAVRQKSYNAEEHRPSLLAHEPVTPLTEVPPDLGSSTQQTSSTKGPGMIPGPSIGQKAKAPLAKIHVSSTLYA